MTLKQTLLISCLNFALNNVYAENGYLPDLMPVTEVVFMGAHNAAMSTKEGWVYAQQSEDLEGLWNSGVRMIKIPLQWYRPSGPKETAKRTFGKVKSFFQRKTYEGPQPFIALCHESPATNNCIVTKVQRGGRDPQPVQQLFSRLAELLEKNPNEVFILKIENDINRRSDKSGTSGYDDAQVITIYKDELERSGLARYAVSLKNRSQPLTLGEMRSQNKRLIILDTMPLPGLPDYVNNFRDYTRQTHWENELMKDCVLFRDNPKSSMFFEMNINPEVSLPTNTIPGKAVNFGTTVLNKIGIKPKGPVEASDYNKINSTQNIKDRMEKCYARHKITPTMITTDFAHVGDLQKVVKELNEKAAAQYKPR